MAVAIRVPDVGTNVDEIKIVRWLKNPGEKVETGEVIAELETDKAVVDLEATIDGYLLDIEIPEGEMAEKGDILAYIGEQQEKVERPSSTVETEEGRSIPGGKHAGEGIERNRGDAMKASPLVRNMARKKSVNLSQVRGTGPGGRIMRADLFSHEKVPGQPAGTTELTGNQLSVAAKVSQSHREIPVVHFKVRIDITAIMDYRNSGLSTLREKLSYDSLFLFAASRVLTDFPLVHSTFDCNRAITGENIHIGFALGIGNDLFIPVIKSISVKSIQQIDEEIRSLVEKGNNRKLSVEDMSGGTFLVSNLGMYPIEEFDAIIPPGYGAALAIGSIQSEPVIHNGGIQVRPVIRMTLSVDHRMVNGRLAAEFLTAMKIFLETGKFD
jgi:pyruvate dehydrogenase E2 component (dihydrolipoamide acetyltransferase)